MKEAFQNTYSIDISTFTVTETILKLMGVNKNGEIIARQFTREYKAVSYQEAESIINLLKNGVEIK